MINYLSKFNYLSIKLITCQNKLIADQKVIDYVTVLLYYSYSRVYHVCRLMHTNNKVETENEVYDVILASSSYFYAFGKFSRRRNRQTRPRRFWVQDVLRRRDDLGEYATLVGLQDLEGIH